MRGRTPGGFGAWVLVPLLAAGPALAEPPDEAVKMARKRFQEGVAAVDAGNYEAARVAFQQAYALKPHPSVLRNLGQAELRTGRYLEAARHLSTFVRDTTYGAAAERESAAKSLAQAEAQVGRVLVQVDVPGADITVDGELAGRSPISDPFYAEPGERLIRIQKEGFDPYEKTQLVEAGRTTQLKISLESAPTLAASVSRYAGPRAASSEATARDAPPSPSGASAPESANRGKTVALLATGGLALAAAGVWIGFSIEGASLENEADDLRARAQLGPSGCAQETPTCAELRDVSHRRATANTIALVGGVATGISAAAFVAAWSFWPKSKSTVARAEVLPSFSSERAGLELRGTF